MSQTHLPAGIEGPAQGTFPSVSRAKEGLLAWAAETDARTLKARSSMGRIVTVGVIAVLGGMAVARAITPRRPSAPPGAREGRAGRSLISWTLAARAGLWLLPYAIRAIQGKRPT